MDFEIEIREADGKDALKMINYNTSVGAETDFLSFGESTFKISEEREARFLERFKKSQKDIMLVALYGDRIIASASIERNKAERYSHRAELSITVLKEFWGKGVGSELMKRLLEFSKESGIESVYLDVRSDNDRAIALYKKFGFSKFAKYNDYFKINGRKYDADLMVLYL